MIQVAKWFLVSYITLFYTELFTLDTIFTRSSPGALTCNQAAAGTAYNNDTGTIEACQVSFIINTSFRGNALIDNAL